MNPTNTSTLIDVRRGFITSAIAACLTLGATMGHAAEQAPASQPPGRVVEYSDLNLATPKGIDHLYRRIAAAAAGVCEMNGDRSLENFELTRICVRQSIAKAVSAVGNPALAALHAAKTGRQPAGAGELVSR